MDLMSTLRNRFGHRDRNQGQGQGPQNPPSPFVPPLDGDSVDAERDLPPHLIRDLAPMRPNLGDPVGVRIAGLLRLHPDLDAEYRGIDLRRIGVAERARLLAEIAVRLQLEG